MSISERTVTQIKMIKTSKRFVAQGLGLQSKTTKRIFKSQGDMGHEQNRKSEEVT